MKATPHKAPDSGDPHQSALTSTPPSATPAAEFTLPSAPQSRGLDPRSIQRLQVAAGNAAVSRLVAQGYLPPSGPSAAGLTHVVQRSPQLPQPEPAPAAPAGTVDAFKMFHIWWEFWSPRLQAANAREYEIRMRFLREDKIKYAHDLELFQVGNRSALGPEYEDAVNNLDFHKAMFAAPVPVLDWLKVKESKKQRVTLDQVNARALEEAHAQGVFQQWMEPILFAIIGGIPGRPGGNLGAVGSTPRRTGGQATQEPVPPSTPPATKPPAGPAASEGTATPSAAGPGSPAPAMAATPTTSLSIPTARRTKPGSQSGTTIAEQQGQQAKEPKANLPARESKPVPASEAERIHALGVDPAVAKYRPSEAETAVRIEQERNVILRRAERGSSADWIDQAGKSYDAVGNFPSQYFNRQWPQLQHQIEAHLKKADLVPVDVSKFSPEQVAKVGQFIADKNLGPRVFMVGQ